MRDTLTLIAFVAMAAGWGAALALPAPQGALALIPGLILAVCVIGRD